MRICPACGKENPEEAKFCLACGTEIPEEEPEALESRKVVTLVFSDVSGSTELGEKADPETVRRVMSRYFDISREVLERHGGTVEKFVGDAVMAVFGIPELHEDDALRAVRAAHELQAGLSELNEELDRSFGVQLRVRTGVNTGEVIAGDASQGEAFATGDAVNVAARLEQAAPPGEILIGAPTQALVRDAVTVEEVESLELKGKSERVPAFRLVDVTARAPGVARRLDSSLVGRDGELRALQEAVERAEAERSCQLALVLGSPGAGKSRLSAELVRTVEDRVRVLEGHCLPYGEGIAFWPVEEIVRQAAGVGETDTGEEARAKIAALLTEDGEGEMIAEHVAALAGLGGTGGNLQELFWALRKLLEALARERPLVVLVDDIHWAEPTLLDLIEYVVGWTAGVPLVVLCLARQELLEERPALATPRPGLVSIVLEPLDESQSEALIENLLGSSELDAEARTRISVAAEGNPLFVEELLRMLIDDGLLRRRNGGWETQGDLSSLTVPPTIHALLAARLDRLEPDERAVIERASVVGRTFWRGAVTELSPEAARPSLPSHLQTLVRKELIRPETSTFAGDDAFRFGHILVRDAAYQGLAKSARAELHERFVEWIDSRAADRASEHDDIAGYHLEQAVSYRRELGLRDEQTEELAVRAGSRLATAGHHAFAIGDMSTAENLLGRAAALLPPEHPLRAEVVLELAEVMRSTGDMSRAAALVEEAVETARGAGDRLREAHARVAQIMLQSDMDPELDTDAIVRVAEDALAVFEQEGDDVGASRAFRAVAEVHLMNCAWRRSAEALEQALVHARRAGAANEEAFIFRHLANAVYWGPTPADEGVARFRQILEEASEFRIVEANVLCYLGGFEAMRGNFEEARALEERGRAMFVDLGHRFGLYAHSIVAGYNEALAGDLSAGEASLRSAYDGLEAMGETGVLSTVAFLLGEVVYAQGRFDEAEELAAVCERTASSDDAASQIGFRALRGKILARQGDVEQGSELAADAVRRAAETDFLDLHGQALAAEAEVLLLAGRTGEAERAAARAAELFERKGNVVAAGRARSLAAGTDVDSRTRRA